MYICNILFGEKYCCLICHIYVNNNKDIFHCFKCGICRLGKKEDYIHCNICDICSPLNHKCIEKKALNECPVCNEYLFQSREEFCILKCNHSIHIKCLNKILNNNFLKCPDCLKDIR